MLNNTCFKTQHSNIITSDNLWMIVQYQHIIIIIIIMRIAKMSILTKIRKFCPQFIKVFKDSVTTNDCEMNSDIINTVKCSMKNNKSNSNMHLIALIILM